MQQLKPAVLSISSTLYKCTTLTAEQYHYDELNEQSPANHNVYYATNKLTLQVRLKIITINEHDETFD